MTYLTAFVQLFRFIQRYRDRAEARRVAEAAERAAERMHQLQMLDGLFTKLVEVSRANAEPILELARAQQAQADVMSAWLKGFAISDPSPTPPQVVNDEALWAQEQRAALAELASAGELPQEFALALQLHEQEQQGFDREGSDF